MSNIVLQPQSDLYNENNNDNIEDPGDIVNEIDLRKVKDAADLQMQKNKQRRSDLNYRLSKQIDLNGSEQSSPLQGENKDNQEQMHFTNRGNIHENLSHYRKSLLPESTSGANR